MKKELRQRLRAVINAIDPEELRARSATACRLLEAQPEYQRAEVVQVFFSLPTEADTMPLVLRAWQDRKEIRERLFWLAADIAVDLPDTGGIEE